MEKDVIYKDYIKLKEEYSIIKGNKNDVLSKKGRNFVEMQKIKENISNEAEIAKGKFDDISSSIIGYLTLGLGIITLISCIILFIRDYKNMGFFSKVFVLVIRTPIRTILAAIVGAIIGFVITSIYWPIHKIVNERNLRRSKNNLRKKESYLSGINSKSNKNQSIEREWQDKFIDLLERI